jgi:hypothetical protein
MASGFVRFYFSVFFPHPYERFEWEYSDGLAARLDWRCSAEDGKRIAIYLDLPNPLATNYECFHSVNKYLRLDAIMIAFSCPGRVLTDLRGYCADACKSLSAFLELQPDVVAIIGSVPRLPLTEI